MQSFLSYLQKIAKCFCYFHSLNFHLSGGTLSVSKQPTQLIIAAHNCHKNTDEHKSNQDFLANMKAQVFTS